MNILDHSLNNDALVTLIPMETVCAGEPIQGLALYTETLNLIRSCRFRSLSELNPKCLGADIRRDMVVGLMRSE